MFYTLSQFLKKDCVFFSSFIVLRVTTFFLLDNACQSILDAKVVSLICNEDTLKGRLQKDINEGKRLPNVIERSITRMELFQELDTVKVVTDRKTVKEIVDEIVAL